MNSTTAERVASSPRSTSSRNFLATENSEASGQGWNQSMTVDVTVARKRCERMRKFSPTGEAVKTMCRLLFTFWMKTPQQFSAVSSMPMDLVSPRIALMISSLSSCGNRSGISPDDSRSLMNTSIFSSTICESVSRNMISSPLTAARLYIFWMSSLKLFRL